MNIESMRVRSYRSIAADEHVPEEAAERYRTLKSYEKLRAVSGNRKFPICGNRKLHTLWFGGRCRADHPVGQSNRDGVARGCTDGRRGCG